MKTILIPAEDHDSMAAVLETARLIALRYGSYIEGFAVHPAASESLTIDPVGGLSIPHTPESDVELEHHVRTLFESFMAAHDIPCAPYPAKSSGDPEPARLSYGWLRSAPETDSFIGSYGRCFDLLVLGRPGPEPQDPRLAPLETALFESGHPVLIAPAQSPETLGQNVLVAWNGSTEQARTTAFAMPLLREAGQVTVLSVEGGMTPGPTGEAVAQQLRMNGVAAKAITIAPGDRTTGEAILDHARSLGCDLLVKGAYTQSRLRQMIFGGATRHILANATMPVLMAH
jgi:nucleotide-binding universal stress UspA family protein